jgi:WD40 repeat protein/beta-lactamase regulating signal transducer with metallopeptidase domain
MRFSREWLVEIAEQSSTALLVDIAVKATVLVLVAMLFLRLLPRSSAAFRHRVWCLTFCGLMVLPALCYLLPTWAVPVLPAWYQDSPAVAAPNQTVTASNPAVVAASSVERPVDRESVNVGVDVADALTAEADLETLLKDKRSAAESVTPVDEVVQTASVPAPEPAEASRLSGLADLSTFWPFSIWLAGAALCLLPLIAGMIRSAMLRARARSVQDSSWIALRDQTCVRLGLSRAVRLLEVDPPIIPMSCGVVRPAVVLPKDARRWNEPLRRFVLLHEIAHIKRHDVVFQLLARLTCVLYWFHPLVWYAMHRLRVERELACDDAVLTAGERASDYAEQLLEVARRLQPLRLHAAVAMAQSNKLEYRVGILFSRARSHLPLSPRASRLLLACAVGLVVVISVVRPTGHATGDDRKSKEAGAEPIRPDQQQAAKRSTEPARIENKAVDDEPLPTGAIARLGTTRFRPDQGTQAVSFLPDKRTLVVTKSDGRLQYWDAQSGRFLRDVRFGKPHVSAAAHTIDGRFVAARGWYREGNPQKSTYWVALLDAQTGEEKLRHEVGDSGRHVVVAENASAIAVDSKEVTIIDLIKGESIEWPLDRLGATALALSADGDSLAVGSSGLVRVWKWRESREPRHFNIARKDPRTQAHINSIGFSPDGTLLAVGDHVEGVRLIDLHSGKELHHLSMTDWRGEYLTFSPDGQWLANPISPFSGGGVAMWEVKTGEFAKRLEMPYHGVRNVTFSPDGRFLAGIPWDAMLCVWNVTTGELAGRDLAGHQAPPNTLRFLPGDDRLATAGEDSTVHLWNVKNAELKHVLKHPPHGGYLRMIRGMDVSPDGRFIATSCLDNTVRVWAAETGQEVYTLPGHGELGGVRSVRFTPDNRRLVSWGDDMHLNVWEVFTGKALQEYRAQPSGEMLPDESEIGRPYGRRDAFQVDSGLLSPDASRLLVLGRNFHIFDVATGREMAKYQRREQTHVMKMTVSPDNQYLLMLTWGYGPEIPTVDGKTTREAIQRTELRRLSSGELLAEMDREDGAWPGAAAFSPDGRRAAITVGKEEARVVIVSVPELTEISRIDGFRAQPRALEFSHSGKLLAVANGDSSVVVYDLENLSRR